MSTIDISGVLRIETNGGIVSVWHARSARDVAEARAIMEAIDLELSRTGIGLLLFDSRDADRTPKPVQDYIWAWLTHHRGLRRVATVMQSAELAANVRATGVGHGIRLKTFSQLAAAREWLVTP